MLASMQVSIAKKDVQNLFQNPFAPAVLIYRTHYVKDMKSNLILAILLLPTLASAAQKLPPEVSAALQFNKWYISQIIIGKEPRKTMKR